MPTAQQLWLRLLRDTILAKYIIFNAITTSIEAVEFDITQRSIYLERRYCQGTAPVLPLNEINALIISRIQENRMAADIFGVPHSNPPKDDRVIYLHWRQQLLSWTLTSLVRD